jgi:hypothetical protein
MRVWVVGTDRDLWRRMALLAFLVALTGCTGAPPSPPPSQSSASPDLPTMSATVEPSPVSSASPAPSGGTTTFTSTRFGYSLELPARWTYSSAATEDWPPEVYPTSASPFSDRFASGSMFPGIDISTQRLADGTTREEFLDWLDTENAKICTVESTEEVTVDEAVGRLQRQTCGYNAWEVTVFDDDRVYLIYWLGEPARMDEERTEFDRFISTFRFAPE